MINAGAGNDVITVGNGNKTIYAGEGHNQVIAGSGNNLIYAGAGNDIIKTGAGDDIIYAGEGNNTISTGTSNDTAYVGNGNTRFILDAGLGSLNIYGFTSNHSISRGITLAADSVLSVTTSGNDTLISAGSDLLVTLKSTQVNIV